LHRVRTAVRRTTIHSSRSSNLDRRVAQRRRPSAGATEDARYCWMQYRGSANSHEKSAEMFRSVHSLSEWFHCPILAEEKSADVVQLLQLNPAGSMLPLNSVDVQTAKVVLGCGGPSDSWFFCPSDSLYFCKRFVEPIRSP
jgi:hypothetical protein